MGSENKETAVAVRVWVEGRRVWLELSDERWLSFPATKYPLLGDAPQDLLERAALRLGGLALRWEEIDEDIWGEDVIRGKFPVARKAAA